MTIIEHKGKQYNLINPITFEEVDAIFRHIRKYLDLAQKMKEATDRVEFESFYSEHVRATDDEHRMIRFALKHSLGLTDQMINDMDYGETKYLFNKVVEMTVILARE